METARNDTAARKREVRPVGGQPGPPLDTLQRGQPGLELRFDPRLRLVGLAADDGPLGSRQSGQSAQELGEGASLAEVFDPRLLQLPEAGRPLDLRSGVLDWDSELFTSGAGIAVLPEDGPEVPASAVVRAGVRSVDLATVLQRLPGDVVLAEGGPSLNGQLAAAGLVEELCLTVAPRIVGGTAGRIVTGPPAAMPMLELAHVLEDDGFLFCRYLRPDPPT